MRIEYVCVMDSDCRPTDDLIMSVMFLYVFGGFVVSKTQTLY